MHVRVSVYGRNSKLRGNITLMHFARFSFAFVCELTVAEAESRFVVTRQAQGMPHDQRNCGQQIGLENRSRHKFGVRDMN